MSCPGWQQTLLLFIPLLISSLVCFWLVTCFLMTRQPLVGQSFLIVKASRSCSDTPLSRTPLDEWSARRRDLYPITYNTHKRQTSRASAGFEPAISAGERPQGSASDWLLLCQCIGIFHLPKGFLPAMGCLSACYWKGMDAHILLHLPPF
jgi:hypothetical protein